MRQQLMGPEWAQEQWQPTQHTHTEIKAALREHIDQGRQTAQQLAKNGVQGRVCKEGC